MPPLQTSVVNRLVRLAFRLGLPDPGDALLETTARRTGRPRLTPVCEGVEGDTLWVISERGRDATWVRDIDASPHAREVLRRASFGRRLCLRASAALATDPVTVRIDLGPAGRTDGSGTGHRRLPGDARSGRHRTGPGPSRPTAR